MSAESATQRRADCERIGLEAAALLRSRFGDPGEIQGKGEPDDVDRIYDVVTEVDFASERLVLGRIAELAPSAFVLAEEGGLTDADGVRSEVRPEAAEELWIVDPLDGTVNFAHGVPHFCVSIACWRGGAPVAGAIVDPMVGETFSFERDPDGEGGAFHDGAPIHLGEGVAPSRTLLTIGGGGPSLVPLMRQFRSWRRIGSAALSLAWTGSGRCGAYVQPGLLHPWDWAVGVPFIQAAGGVVTDGGGLDWTPRLSGTTGLIAASRTVHADIAELAAAAGASG
ncbi:MAG: Inositol(or 4)-monophosphatase [Thermoleophilia bacterium]|nr:Inositol(or 4)-monophosphatase [Thermoleophilia bacterium]